jgi:hypothetical protein
MDWSTETAVEVTITLGIDLAVLEYWFLKLNLKRALTNTILKFHKLLYYK